MLLWGPCCLILQGPGVEEGGDELFKRVLYGGLALTCVSFLWSFASGEWSPLRLCWTAAPLRLCWTGAHLQGGAPKGAARQHEISSVGKACPCVCPGLMVRVSTHPTGAPGAFGGSAASGGSLLCSVAGRSLDVSSQGRGVRSRLQWLRGGQAGL